MLVKKVVDWDKVSRFEECAQSPGFLLWKVSTKWRRWVENALARIGLTHPQFVLLANISWLTRNGNEVTQVELARHCNTDVTMTSQVLRTLERKGYIKRKHRKGDERSKLSYLTERGVELVEKAIPLVEGVDSDFFGGLGDDAKICVEILQKLV